MVSDIVGFAFFFRVAVMKSDFHKVGKAPESRTQLKLVRRGEAREIEPLILVNSIKSDK